MTKGGARFPSSSSGAPGKNNLQRMSGNADALYARAPARFGTAAYTIIPQSNITNQNITAGPFRLWALKNVTTKCEYDRIAFPMVNGPAEVYCGIYELLSQPNSTRGFGAKLVQGSACYINMTAVNQFVEFDPTNSTLKPFELDPAKSYAFGMLVTVGPASFRSENVSITTTYAVGGAQVDSPVFTSLPDSVNLLDTADLGFTLITPLILVVPRGMPSKVVMT